MFTKHAAEPAFTPDTNGLYVVTLDTPIPAGRGVRTSGWSHMIPRLIGRHRAADGSTRLVILPLGGHPRHVEPDEPHRILTAAEANTFDVRTWRRVERQAAADAHSAELLNARRREWRAQLLHALVLDAGPRMLDARTARDLGLAPDTISDWSHGIADELIADGLARTLDDTHIVTTQHVDVELSRWPYLGIVGQAVFAPAPRGTRVLVHAAPASSGGVVRSGRFPVIGTVTLKGAESWTAYLAQTRPHGGLTVASVELVGPHVPGYWESADAGQDVREWVDARQRADEELATLSAVAQSVERLREELLAQYAVTPRNAAETAACDQLAAEGLCYPTDGSYVLARAV